MPPSWIQSYFPVRFFIKILTHHLLPGHIPVHFLILLVPFFLLSSIDNKPPFLPLCGPCTIDARQFHPLRNNNLYKVNVVKGSLLDYAKSVNAFENVNIGDPTTDIPDSARYCMAHIMNRANSWFISIEGRDNRLYTNYNNGNDWTGWHSTALRSDLDNKIQCGLSSIGEISPGESTSEITFPHSFPTAPKSVVGNIRYIGYGDSLSMQITGITTTGFSVYIHNTSSGKVSIAIYWIACLN